MTLNEFRFTYKTNDIFKFMLVADLHVQSPEADTDRFKQDLKTIEGDDKAFIIGNGDWFDAIVVPDIRYSKQSDKTQTPAIVNECADELENIMMPYRDQILGIGIGNHEMKYIRKCGTDPVQLLCKSLSTDTHKIKHLGYSAAAKFLFELEGGGHVKSFVYYQHHGWGAGMQTEGGAITKYAKHATGWRAMFHVYGHDHHKVFKELPTRLGMATQSCKWVEEKEYLVLAGSYLKTLNKLVYPTYSEEKGMRPTPLGCVVISVQIKHDEMIIIDASYI